MMENKLYYQDAYLQSFTAKLLKQAQDETKNWYAVLDQTAFYPTGGGQPHDLGTIAGQKVVNVEEMDGEIRHYLEGPIEAFSHEVTGQIDWFRRFDHMQQHAGQHLLSAAFDRLFSFKTVGFHLGTEIVTIDLETEELTEDEAAKAEELANRIILENRPIETKWVTEEELSQFQLRKETKVKENIRLVIVPDFDDNGCGGTHPSTTGEVRAIKILDWERQKKKIRLQFVCGERVLTQFSKKQKVLLGLTRLISAPEHEMEQAVLRLLETGKDTEKELEKARDLLLQFEGKEIWKSRTGNVIGEVYQNRTVQELQKMARYITTENEEALVLLVSEGEDRLQLVCARGNARSENMNIVLKQALTDINGKGGGNAAFAQGGGPALIPSGEMLERLMASVK